MVERFAIYYAPDASSALWQRAAQWLGRDAHSLASVEAPFSGLDALHLRGVTRSARRYGFHATIKAPLVLAAGTTREKLLEALQFFSQAQRAVPVGAVELRTIDGFLALVPVRQSEELSAFVQSVVSVFEPFRAPLSASQRAARIAAGLSERQVELLDQFGYPYVAEEFRFHMTLTDRLVASDREGVIAAARAWFAPVIPPTLAVDRLSLFHEPDAGAPFVRIADFPLSRRVSL